MARIVLVDKRGWELPDFFSFGPDTIDCKEDAELLVSDVIQHHISQNKLASVHSIRVEDTNGVCADFLLDDLRHWRITPRRYPRVFPGSRSRTCLPAS